MRNIYFALTNNNNTKKHIENIQKLIQDKEDSLDVRGEENSPIIFIDISSKYNLLSYVRRNSSNVLELVIYNKNNFYGMVDIPMEDIDTLYMLG